MTSFVHIHSGGGGAHREKKKEKENQKRETGDMDLGASQLEEEKGTGSITAVVMTWLGGVFCIDIREAPLSLLTILQHHNFYGPFLFSLTQSYCLRNEGDVNLVC